MYKILVMQKPAARDRIGIIKNWLEENTNGIIAEKDVLVDDRIIKEHYKEHADKDFYPTMTQYYVGKKVRVWIVEVEDIAKLKEAIGHPKAQRGGFRQELMGDRIKEVIEKFGVMDNGIHASDSEESGKREISLWFGNSYLSPSSSNELPNFKEWLKNRCS